MSATTELSNEDLQTVLGLIRDADSVELKLTIHESARADAARALGVDPLDSQIRQVFFFDTPELALNAAGVVVRARRRQNEEGDTVVKLRPVVPNELAEELRASVVQPAQRSPGALRKARTRLTADGLPVQSFQTLLKNLSTIVKNRIQPKLSPASPAFDAVTRPSALQQRALSLLEVTLPV
jgi:hypothetical protein